MKKIRKQKKIQKIVTVNIEIKEPVKMYSLVIDRIGEDIFIRTMDWMGKATTEERKHEIIDDLIPTVYDTIYKQS